MENTKLPAFPALEGELRTDVLIIGGGLTGILCARMLESAGINYLLLEAGRICGGTTGRTTAKITVQHGLLYDKLIRQSGEAMAGLYLRANEEALDLYRRLCREISCDFEEKDSFLYTTGDPDQLKRELEAVRRLGGRAEWAEDIPLPLPVTGAVRMPGQAQFDPLKFLSAIVKGLHICENSPVRSYDGHSFRTDRGQVTAKKAIVASHFPIFNKHGGYFLKLYQHRSYLLALRNAGQVDGMYMDADKEGFSFRDQGDLLLLGGGAHRTGKNGGGWNALEAFAAEHYAGAEVVGRWAAQDCMSLDGVPYIGRYSHSTPDLFVATGYNKWGFTSAMAAAVLLTGMVQGKESPYEAVFSPSRSILHPQLAVNGLETAVNLLTPTVPRCPHLGCALKWNAAEQSWDCPCHGSRFAGDGRLLDGPATGDLKQK